ncbi:MAG: hypothetical protein ACTHOK_02680, partial [Nocardioidaceae bacterium]
VGLVVALSPVTFYSMSIVAPNGIEMAAAIGLWSCLLGLAKSHVNVRTRSRLIICAGVFAVILVLPRTLGPLWLALVAITSIAAIGLSQLTHLLRAAPRHLAFSLTACLLATAGSVAWTLSAQTNLPSAAADLRLPSPITSTIAQTPLWVLQMVAAFPRRYDAAPTVVYVAWVALLLGLIVLALRPPTTRLTKCLVAALLLSLVVPWTITAATYAHLGPVWQGRYGLPYTMGVPLLAGLILDRSHKGYKCEGAWFLAGGLLVAVAHAASLVGTLNLLSVRSPALVARDPFTAPPWVPVVLAISAIALWAYGTRQFPPGVSTRSDGDAGDHNRRQITSSRHTD